MKRREFITLAAGAAAAMSSIDTFDLGPFVGSHEQLRRVATGPQLCGQHRHDLDEGITSGFGQRLVGPLCYPSRTQDQRLDLIICQHERRK
jgi:hypothetical protein